MILNTIMADSMHYMADEIEKEIAKNIPFEDAINNVVIRTLKQHHQVVFNGNGYSEDWVKEAERRGLKNLRTAPEAIREFTAAKNISLFERMKVLSKREIESQQHILYENFVKTVQIESACLSNMISSYIVPACLEFKKTLLTTVDANEPAQAKILKTYNTDLSSLITLNEELYGLIAKGGHFEEDKLHEQATFYRQDVMSTMEKVRKACDSLELLTDDKLWPFPKYSEMLFLK